MSLLMIAAVLTVRMYVRTYTCLHACWLALIVGATLYFTFVILCVYIGAA